MAKAKLVKRKGKPGGAKRGKPGSSRNWFTMKKLPPEIDERALTSGGYPYDKKMKRKPYEEELYLLHIELLKVQEWARKNGERIAIVFEGRDAAGKGGAIHRFTQHLNPRAARVVALPKPTETEQGQWYFQRYIDQFPTRGEIVLFDRSWYNRAGVEPVMGFCTEEQHEEFLEQAPKLEQLLVDDGIRLFKLWLHIGREMQIKRQHARANDPLKRWKLGPVDFKSIEHWADYSRAFGKMIEATDTPHAPWTVILANDKLRTRLNAIRVVLSELPYTGRIERSLGEIDRKIVLSGEECLARGLNK
jgi:polyphosphate kinase